MAIVRATKTGNWSDTTVWNTGALPTSADDVYSNTFTVTIDTSPTVLSIGNGTATGVTAGGTFVPTNGITLTCTAANGIVGGGAGVYVFDSSLTAGQSCTVSGNVTVGAGTTIGLRNNGAGTVTVNGNITAGTNTNNFGANNASTGTLTVVGNVSGGTSTNCPGVVNGSTGTINITGTVTANYGFGASNTSTGTINITGNVNGGQFTSIYGASNSSSGSINITGNVTAGSGTQSSGTGSAHGANNGSTGTVTITGTVAGHATVTNSNGAVNASTGTLTVNGTVQANAASGVASPNVAGNTILTGPFLTNASGVSAIYCARWFWQNTTPPATYYQIRSANLSVIRPLYTADSVGGNPATSNVRSGTVYGPNSELTGTCAVPGAASVVVGVPVDNTVGTAAVTAATIRSAVGLASANLDTQLAAAAADSSGTTTLLGRLTSGRATALDNLDATVSSRSTYAGGDTSGTTTLLGRLTATRAGNLDSLDATVSSRSTYAGGDTSGTTTLLSRLTSGRAAGLDNLDASISSRLATSGYTAPPSAASIRTEIDTNSTKLDATVSSRLASASYTAAPTTSAIRTELSTELARIDAAISSRSTYAGGDTSGTTTLLGRLTSGRASALDNLDATVSSRSTYSGADTSGTTTLLGRLTSTRASGLDNLDATVSSRLSSSSYTTPPTVAAIVAAIDKTGYSLTEAERTAIATAVQAGILNESDGQQILNAIVGAIGNTNVDQVALVAAIRADLERSGGTLATRLAASAYTAPPSSATVASSVRSELATELSRLDVEVSSRLAPDGTLATVTTLTNAPDVPTPEEIAAEVWSTTVREVTGGNIDSVTTLVNAPDVPSVEDIATGVRTELSTELAHLDADVSSRLAPDGTLAHVTLVDTVTDLTNAPDVPTPTEIAEQVRLELNPELSRVANTATTQEVADIVEGALQQP